MARAPTDGFVVAAVPPAPAVTLSLPEPNFTFPALQRPAKAERSPVKRGNGSHSGPKACTQCGTTRTPQWREGPAGPKTLCNACGVKLVRKNRSMLEAKRRAAGLGPTPKGTPLRQLLLSAECAGSPAHSGAASEPDASHPSSATPRGGGDAGGTSPSRRPLRKAAARAAERTAEFASTGDWPQEVSLSLSTLSAARPRPQDSGASAASGQNSDAAEEVAWAPAQLAEVAGPGPLPRGLLHESTSAAVDLLTMTAKLPEPTVSTPRTPAQTEAAVPGHTKLEEAVLATVAEPDIEADQAAEDEAAQAAQQAARSIARSGAVAQLSAGERLVEHYLRTHLPSKAPVLDAIAAEAEDGWRQAAAADAAVAAVAKFLAQKQAAAIQARAAARAATQRLHTFLQGVDDQHQILRAHKRRRAE